jgi:hypothetical protein
MRHDESKPDADEQETTSAPRIHAEVVPWAGGDMAGRPEPTELEPVVAPPKVVRVRRSLLIWLICLLAAAALVIAGLVKYLPAHRSTANRAGATASPAQPSASATSGTTPSPAATAADSPAATTADSPAASASAAVSGSAVAAGGGGAGAPLADLSALTPVSQANIGEQSTGPEQIGSTTYEDSVRFTCASGDGSNSGDMIYDVAGYKYLTTLIGIPSDAPNGSGNAMTITFYKDGSATQLSSPVTVTLDHPQSIHLDLQGSSQLEISCSAINTTSQQATAMDVAFGNATIGPN